LGEIGLAGRVQRKVPIVFFSGKVSPNFDPKNMISTYTKGVLMEKMTEISRISKNFIPNRHLIMIISSMQPKKYRRILQFFLLSYLISNKIWLKHLIDDRHFS
jgi:hypothetical protein